MTTRFPRLRELTRRRAVALTAVGAAVALAGAGATAAVAATPSTSASSSTSSSSSTPCEPGVGALLRALPGSLRTDLKHLSKDAAGSRAADRAAIKKKALAGGYGLEIERVAKIAAGDTSKLTSAIPAALKADLKTLRGDAKGSDARKAEVTAIWNKAIAGSYGPSIESLAKDAKARADKRCAAKASAQG